MLPTKPLEQEDDDEFERRLESDPRFLARVAKSRQQFREGKGVRMEDIKFDDEDPK
jgi:hypothetical protein